MQLLERRNVDEKYAFEIVFNIICIIKYCMLFNMYEFLCC